MDPIAVLQSRIEQLETKLGYDADTVPETSVTNNLLNVYQAVTNAITGHEKLSEAVQIALKLDKYTDPNYIETSEQCNKQKLELAAAESVLRRYAEYLNRCKQIVPILESEAMKHVPEMQESVDKIFSAAVDVKSEAEEVSNGIQKVAEMCGGTAAATSQQLASVAQQVQATEQKLLPHERSSFD